MRLLVTGGAGFIGSNFVRKQLNNYEKITVLDKFTYSGVRSNLTELEQQEKITVLPGDICDKELVYKLVANFDAIINFAAESHVDRSIKSSAEFVYTNTLGVQVLLDAILNVKPNIRFLQVSTDEVYGTIQTGSWDEEDPLEPNSPYAASKASGELIARSYCKTHGLDILISRCSNNYGNFQFPEKLIPLAITNIIEGKKIPIYGKGENIRDWLHVDDHCYALEKILKDGKSGSVYNIGGGVELSNLDLITKILTLMDKTEKEINYVDDRKGHDFRYSVNWSKINQELRYKPSVDFEEGLNQTIIWYRENTSWWRPLKSRKEV